MPLSYSRKLTGKKRSRDADWHLGMLLAFVAGALNAGGFLAVGQYTSHMTGIVSSMADHLALGVFSVYLTGLGALISFLAGATSCAMLVNFSRRRDLHSEFAVPLLLEAALLLFFGLVGAKIAQVSGLFVPAAVMLLCFIMGLQNAVITKLSNSVIRTTHITGIVTDLGIEFGKMLYWNRHKENGQVIADWPKVKVLASLAFLFFWGGFIGALGFKHIGFGATIPLAIALVWIALAPLLDDLKEQVKT